MPLVSANTLIRILVAAHVYLAYLLIVSPQKVSEQNAIFILGEALGLQQPTSSLWENRLGSSIAGLILLLSSVSDLTAVSSKEEVAREYWSAQGPVRCLFFSVLTGYVYAFKPGRGNVNQDTVEPLLNSVVFSWAFFEAIWWFWIYTNLREEKSDAQARMAQRRKLQEEMKG